MASVTAEWGIPFLDYAYQQDSRLNYETAAFSDLEGHMHENTSDAFSAVFAADLCSI